MGLIATTWERVAPPRLLPDAGMAILREGLRACGYDLASCAERLGVFPRLGVNFWPALRQEWTPDEQDAVDTLLMLWIENEDVGVDALRQHVSSEFIDALVASGLAEMEGALLRSKLCLFPCYGKFIVTDRASKNKAINQVMWLWGESYILGGMVKRTPRMRAIDVGTGSGVHAILAGDHCESVVGVDINPRALEFARFNAALNGASNVEFVLSDLFDGVEGGCDLLLANPPYLPDGEAGRGENFWSGGREGTRILSGIVEAVPERLEGRGTAHLIALYPNAPGTTIREHFDAWLGGRVEDYDVLDHTWAVPHYQDQLSEQPFAGDKSAWRFGVVSLRRAETGKGWWKQAGGAGVFFGADGSCSVVADHDAG